MSSDDLSAFIPTTESRRLPCSLRPDVFFASDGPETPEERAARVAEARRLCQCCHPDTRVACSNWSSRNKEWGIWAGRAERVRGMYPGY